MRSSPDPVEVAIGDLLWQQWRAMGVLAAAAPAHQLIDPEALLIESAVVAERIEDPRIADAAISWAERHHQLITTARLKSLLKRYDAPSQQAFLVLSRRVIDLAGRLAWPAAESASAWKSSIDIATPRLSDQPSLQRLRTRAIFGANARAEVMAYLSVAGQNGTDLATLERGTSFSKRHLAGPLDGLILEGSVERSWLGNRQHFRLGPAARAFLGAQRDLSWIDWHGRLRAARVVGSAMTGLAERGGVVAAMGAIRADATLLQEHGLQAPRPLQLDEAPEDRSVELAAWLSEASTRLLAA